MQAIRSRLASEIQFFYVLKISILKNTSLNSCLVAVFTSSPSVFAH
jgi:hypothetical protein